MSITSIVRMGGPPGNETSMDILRQALLSHFSNNTLNSKEDASQSPQLQPAQQSLLQLDNKYFTAFVKISPIEESNETNILEQEDGILLVIPSTMTCLESITEWHDDAQRKELAGDSLRLLLATHVTANAPTRTTKQYEEQYSQRVLWCLDRGYEYIEVDVTSEGLTRGFEDREKDGFARVCEAMSGTVWGSAIMKKKKKQQTVARRVVQEETGSSSSLPQAQNHSEETAKHEEEKIEPQIESKPSTAVSSPEPASPPPPAEEKEEKEGEEYLNNIEHIMKEAQHIRQASKKGELTDEQRRQRAGDAASMLMGLLDQMGFDDEDGVDSSSDEDE